MTLSFLNRNYVWTCVGLAAAALKLSLAGLFLRHGTPQFKRHKRYGRSYNSGDGSYWNRENHGDSLNWAITTHSFINLLSSSNLEVGEGLHSCTDRVQVAQPFNLDGWKMTLLDTPGFDDTTKTDTHVLDMIATYLKEAYVGGKKLTGIIYIHRISDNRMGGVSTRNLKMFRRLCGENTLRNVAIVTNMWGQVDRAQGDARECELASNENFFKPVLDKGARLHRHDNGLASGHGILRYLLGNHPQPLRIQQELVDEGKSISQTDAGMELEKELKEQARMHEEKMRILHEETQAEIRRQEEERRKIVEAEVRKVREEQARMEAEARRYAEERARIQREIRAAARAEREEAERAAAEARRQAEAVQDQMRRAALAAEAEQAELHRRLAEARDSNVFVRQLLVEENLCFKITQDRPRLGVAAVRVLALFNQVGIGSQAARGVVWIA
ncbi:hypothetical protein BD779DRAFT_1466201 [Infundibulicybe gibba]|nr:hypothetical protein BD779DRAFT_1466201 [Infundibulicybe gibba]